MSAQRVQAHFLDNFRFVEQAMLHEQCSAYAMENMQAEVLASLGYVAQVLKTGNDNVQRLLAELVAEPSTAQLQYNPNSREFVNPSTAPPSGADVTMATGTSVPHFAELLRDQNVTELVRITPLTAHTEYGHLVALGSEGFCLCTCLRLLIGGLCCRHGLKAMHGKELSFNGTCITPRWRDGAATWTMAALAAKPAKLSATGMEGSGQFPPVDTDDASPVVFSHSEPTVRSHVFGNFCTLGKELASMAVD